LGPGPRLIKKKRIYRAVVSQRLRNTAVDHTQSHTHTYKHTQNRTPLDERSDRLRGRYLHNTHKQKRRTSMVWAGFEPAIQEIKWPQT